MMFLRSATSHSYPAVARPGDHQDGQAMLGYALILFAGLDRRPRRSLLCKPRATGYAGAAGCVIGEEA
jgi:hypothetical protein